MVTIPHPASARNDACTHCHSGAGADENAVFGDAIDSGLAGGRIRAIDHLWVDGCLNGFENGFATPSDAPGWGFRFKDHLLHPLS